MLASRSPCWSSSTPFVCSHTRRTRVSLSSNFALSAYLVCVGFVRIPSLWICHEGSALIFRFWLDFFLQSACHQHIGLDRSGNHRLVAEFTYTGRSRTDCSPKEDFNHVYGLSLEGIERVVVTDKLISDIDWFSVYKVPRVKGKVMLKHVWPEFYDDYMRLHQKVRQDIPVNNKFPVAFARA